MESEGQAHGSKQEGVDPGLHDEERLVLGERVEGVAHLDGDQDGEGHGHGLGGLKIIYYFRGVSFLGKLE